MGFTSGYTKCVLSAATGSGAGTGEGSGWGSGVGSGAGVDSGAGVGSEAGMGSGAGVDSGAGAALSGELLGLLMVAPTGMLEAQPQCQSARRYPRTTCFWKWSGSSCLIPAFWTTL